jgi:hypothetical protein
MDTLAALGAAEERRGKRKHPSRGRSGLHIASGGGQPTQDVVRVSDMDNERNLSAPRGGQPTHVPLEAVPCLANSVKEAVACPLRAPNSVTANGMKMISRRLLTPPSTFQTWSSQHDLKRLQETGDYSRRTNRKPRHQPQVLSRGCRGSARHPHPQGGRRCRWGVN